MDALYFAEKDEAIQCVMRKDKLLQLCKLSELVKVWMVDDEIKPHVGQVKLLNHIVEL